MLKPTGYLSGWRWLVAPLRGLVAAALMLLVALGGRADAQTSGPIQAIAAGDQHALAIVHDVRNYGCGLVWGWGADWNGQVGNHIHAAHASWPPDRVVGPSAEGYFTGAQTIAAGMHHSLALRNDGTVWAWGDNAHGQLGVNSDNDKDYPVQVHGTGNVGQLTGVTAVAAGAEFSLAVRSDGTVYAWGNGEWGQLGLNSEHSHQIPYQVHGPGDVGYLSGITAVAAGEDFSLALKNDGTVWAWGHNNPYELGNGTLTSSYTPVQVKGPDGAGFLTDVVAIAAGNYTGLALKRDGTVWAWGDNRYGQLGVNSDNPHGYPVQVHGPGNVGFLSGITGVSAGEDHSLAVKSDGSVYAWGRNNNGQLGVHSDNPHPYPVQVHGVGNVGFLGGITSVSAGEYFSMALNSAGTAIFAWGGNSYFQLGNGSQTDSTVPVQVRGLAGSSPCPAPQLTQGAPRLTNVTQSASRWRVGRKLPRTATTGPPVGTTFAFTLNRPARVWFSFTFRTIGRRVGGECVARSNANRRRPRCRRTARVAFSRQARAGRTRLRFEGRLDRRRRLAPGRYRLSIFATADWHRSKPAILRFTILPGSRRTSP